ncbi:MAG: hypothetical protein ACKOC8_02075 [Pirellulales bacterium]
MRPPSCSVSLQLLLRVAVIFVVSPVAVPGQAVSAADTGRCELRVESALYADGGSEPVASSLALFHEGVTWDFLESPVGKVREIVLHDPARERIVVIDPVRQRKTQVEAIQLERLSVSLAAWTRGSEDRLVRWAGGPDFTTGFTEDEGRLELAGPRVRYAVAFEEAPSREAAETYRRFADMAILLKALLQPGGIPPFPRLAVNRRLEEAGALPAEVSLEIDPKLSRLAARPARLRCVHQTHPRLLSGDLERIEQARAHLATARHVDLAEFVVSEDEGIKRGDDERSPGPGS